MDAWVAALVVVLAATLAGSWWLASRRTERIRHLEDIASRIGRGEVARALEQPGDALGRLGAALNRMAADLRERVDALRRERDERERILAHMSDGVALVDGAGRILHMNHSLAAMLDASRPAATGTPLQEFARAPELSEVLLAARREARTVDRDVRLWTPTGRQVRVTATPLGADSDAVLLVVHDLTEAEMALRMRQEFVANVSHELRTPLTSLRGYAETLLEGGLDDAENREAFVRVMRDQAVRLQELVEDLLALAELERPDAMLRLEEFDLRAVAERQIATLRDAATRAGLALELAAGPAVHVKADRVRIEQAAANLFDNAVKYTERGRIDVRIGGDAQRAWFEVRDTGPGIPPEDLPRIFERFYRVDKARSRDKGGTGLGLSIVKHVVGLHGGEVAVASTPGEGSVFRFEIPRVALEAHGRG